jgi:hypothetical protein
MTPRGPKIGSAGIPRKRAKMRIKKLLMLKNSNKFIAIRGLFMRLINPKKIQKRISITE